MIEKTANTGFTVQRFMPRVLGLSGTALLVYAAIYSFSIKGGECFASVDYLADCTGASPTSVKRAIKKLREDNYIFKCGESEYRTVCYMANMRLAHEAKRMLESGEVSDELLLKIQNDTAPEDRNDALTVSKCYGEGFKMAHNNKEINKYTSTTAATGRERLIDKVEAPLFLYLGEEELVMLTMEQYQSLFDLLGEELLNHYIMRVQAYLMNYPSRTINSHYRTILKWVKEDTAL